MAFCHFYKAGSLNAASISTSKGIWERKRRTNADEPCQAESSRTQRLSRALGGTCPGRLLRNLAVTGVSVHQGSVETTTALRAAAFGFMVLLRGAWTGQFVAWCLLYMELHPGSLLPLPPLFQENCVPRQIHRTVFSEASVWKKAVGRIDTSCSSKLL